MTDKTYQLHVRKALIGRLSCNHGELGQVFECFIKVLQGWLYMNEDEIDRIGITCLKTYIMMASCNSLLITSSLGGSFCLGVKMYFLFILSVDGLVSLPYLVAKIFYSDLSRSVWVFIVQPGLRVWHVRFRTLDRQCLT